MKFIFAAALACAMSGAAATAAGLSAKPAKTGTNKTAGKPVKKEPARKSETKLAVYYFHGFARCASCRKIEQYTKEAVEKNFSGGGYAGKVAFMPVNVEEKPNEHFVKDYQLVSKSVILQPEKDGKPGKWKNLDRIWLELGDKDKFVAYIKSGVIEALEGK